MACGQQQMLKDGNWMEAIISFLTNCGDPAMQVIAPTAIYGGLLMGLFIYSGSGVMPIIVSIILGGVIFAAFPANALTIVVLSMMAILAAGGQWLTWRMGT